MNAVKLLSRFTAWAHRRARNLCAVARWAWTWLPPAGKSLPWWGIVLTLLGLLLAVTTIVVDLEDRQSERTSRAWQVVREYENRAGTPGSSLREALQFLNHEFDGALCLGWVGRISQWLTGNRRECFFPRKNRESLARISGRGVNLMGIDLSGADLTEADLTGVILRNSTLRDATLRDVRLLGADLVGADLVGADLTGADLSLSDAFTRAGFREALGVDGMRRFTRADLSEALWNGHLTCADLSEALKNIYARDINARDRPSRHRADLSEADLSEADLSEADLLGANLTGANLSSANLGGADLSCVDETDAIFTGANLTAAKGRDLSGTMLRPD